MVKIGAKAEKAVFRSNLSGFSPSHIQEAIDDDEGIGGSSTVDINMDVDDMDRILDTIVSNYTLWRNDSTFTDSGSNPSREEQMEAIRNDYHSTRTRSSTMLLIHPDRSARLPIGLASTPGTPRKWRRASDVISRATPLTRPLRKLAIALYTDMGDKDAGKFILRRANAATKRRLGREHGGR